MLSLSHLKYFQDTALLGSVAAAAKRHRVSPSAVSQAIKGLESHFGVALSSHASNKFELTGEGKALLDRSFKVFAATDSLHEEMAWLKASYAGHVAFGTQQSIAHHLLPKFIAMLQQKYPEMHPRIRLAPTDVVKRWLELRDTEFSLSVDNVAHEAFASIPIYQGRFLLVESKAAKKRERVFITPGESTREAITFRRDYEAHFGAQPRVAMEIKSWGVVKRFAELGMGTGLIPDYLMRFDEARGLSVVDLGLPEIPYRINAYYCGRRNQLSKIARVFLEELEDFVKEI